MKLISSVLESISPSPIFKLALEANILRSRGIEVFDFSIGEPDFDSPDNIKEASYQAIKSGKTKYTAIDGIKELKKAIIQKYSDRLKLDLENIIVSNGAKQVIFNAIFATVTEGMEVIIPSPYWSSYPDIVKLSRGTPVILKCIENNNFKIVPEELEKIITDKTKWLILNSPCNPTGSKYSKEELEKIAKVLETHPNIYVLSDDIYEDIFFDEEPFSMIDFAGTIKSRVFVVHGVSKSYAMTGWRIGYGIGPVEMVKAMTTIQSQTTSNPCSISQYASVEALLNSKDFIDKNKSTFATRLEKASELIDTIQGLSFIKPLGAFYLFINCSECLGKKDQTGNIVSNDMEFCKYLLEEARVIVVPGSAFGSEGYFRLSYAAPLEVLEKGILEIKRAVDLLI